MSPHQNKTTGKGIQEKAVRRLSASDHPFPVMIEGEGATSGAIDPSEVSNGDRPKGDLKRSQAKAIFLLAVKKLGSKDTRCPHHMGICNLTAWSWIFWSKASWSKVPSLCIGISAAGITKGSRKRRNSPSSKVMPFASICSPADVAA